MFVAELTPEKQEVFLNLAYTMVYADGRLDEKEDKLFKSYALEVTEEMLSKAHNVDFENELAKLADCTRTEKLGIFFELYAIALIDESYPEEEKILVDIMKKHFDVSDDKMNEMREGLKAFTDSLRNLEKIVSA